MRRTLLSIEGSRALVAGCCVLALSGCGSGGKTPTIPPVEHVSRPFALDMDRIGAHSTGALIGWAKSRSKDTTAPYRVLVREGKRLRSLRPPAGEQQAFSAFLASFQRLTDAWGRITVFPQGLPEIAKSMEPDGRVATQLARRLGAKTCALQTSGNAH